MQLYHCTNETGQLIMQAPLETIEQVFAFSLQRTALLLERTRKLDSEYGFPSSWPRWRYVYVKRLPLEIPLGRQAE